MIEFKRDPQGHLQFRQDALAQGSLSMRMMEAEQALRLASGKGGLALAAPPAVLARHPYAHLLAAYRKGLASASELGDTPLMLGQLPASDVQALSATTLLVMQDIRLLPVRETRGQSFALAPMDAPAEARFREDLAALSATLGPAWSAFIGILSTITFVDVASMPGLPYFSGSSNLTFGAIHMIHSGKPSVLAECITHEAAHTWLGLVDGQDRLARDMWNEAMPCISPWREDPRPIGGIVHGVFVFSCVLVVLAILLERASDAEEAASIRKRLARLASQVEEGIAALRTSGLLTEAGEQLCLDSDARLQAAIPDTGDEWEPARQVVLAARQRKRAALRARQEGSHAHF
jgi:HEXXH motif-containing protein